MESVVCHWHKRPGDLPRGWLMTNPFSANCAPPPPSPLAPMWGNMPLNKTATYQGDWTTMGLTYLNPTQYSSQQPCGVVWCGVVWCGVVWCGVVWCGVVWCGVVWCGVVWCGVVWCGVVWWISESGEVQTKWLRNLSSRQQLHQFRQVSTTGQIREKEGGFGFFLVKNLPFSDPKARVCKPPL